MNSSLKLAAMSATICAVAGIPDTALANRITVGAFEIDQTEVTVSEFAAFAAVSYTHLTLPTIYSV